MKGINRLAEEEKKFLLKVSRKTLELFFSRQKSPVFENVPSAVLVKRPVFVTLRSTKTKQLRGCRGETVANHTLLESVKKMSIASAIDDPRFKPVTLEEIPELHIEINALTPMQLINTEDVIVGKHGLMLVKDYQAGLLLPAVPVQYNWDKETYLDQLCLKAGLPTNTWRDEPIELYAFESEEWGEEE